MNPINPIEKHRSEIEKKISQLQKQFSKDRPDIKDPYKRHRDYVQDQNKIYGHPINLSKTMQVKGRQRGLPGQISRLKKNYAADEHSYLDDVLSEVKEVPKNILPPRDDGKEEKIKELEYMVKSLLQGQKVLQKQLNQLKAKNAKEQINKLKLTDQSAQQYDTPLTFVSNKSPNSLDQSKNALKKRTSANNHSVVMAEGISKEKQARKGSATQNKRKDFEELYQQLKERSRGDRRWVVQEEWKSRMWGEVEARVRESDKEYKDTMHHNNKHEFEHLMSTYQLQRKLKDDLINKVYQQCNDQIYK